MSNDTTFAAFFFFFFNDTATTEIYTLSLHDALPISPDGARRRSRGHDRRHARGRAHRPAPAADPQRSEEHTSELQSQSISYAVFCLKKKKKKTHHRLLLQTIL